MSKFKWSLAQKGLLVISIPLVLQLGVFYVLDQSRQQAEYIAQRQNHNKEIFGHTNWIAALVSMTSLYGTQYVATNDPRCKEWISWCRKNVRSEIDLLLSKTADDPNNYQNVQKLSASWKTLESLLDTQLLTSDTTSSEERISQLKMSESSIRSVLAEINASRHDILLSETNDGLGKESLARVREQQHSFLLAGVIVSILSAVLMFTQFTKGITSRLSVLTGNAKKLAEGESLSPPAPGSDEVAILDQSFHEMATALSEARSNLEESAQRLRTMIIAIPLGIAITDGDGMIEFSNPSLRDIFIEKDLNGTSLRKLLTVSDKQWQEILSQEQIVECETVSMDHGKDASEIVVGLEISACGVTIDNESKYLIVLQNITSRLELQRLRQEFIAMVTHDLRSPLTSIDASMTMIEALMDNESGGDDTKVKRNIDVAKRASGRLLRLVNDLLDHAKLESGSFNLLFAQTSLADVLEKSIAEMKPLAEKRKIELKILESKDLNDVLFDADESRIVQVVVNLLGNAIKFSPADSQVAVESFVDEKSVKISVVDRGPGVPESMKASIFEKFKQVSPEHGKRGQGTGLGLSICKALIEGHGGTIGVEDVPGGGSAFWFRLPLFRAGD